MKILIHRLQRAACGPLIGQTYPTAVVFLTAPIFNCGRSTYHLGSNNGAETCRYSEEIKMKIHKEYSSCSWGGTIWTICAMTSVSLKGDRQGVAVAPCSLGPQLADHCNTHHSCFSQCVYMQSLRYSVLLTICMPRRKINVLSSVTLGGDIHPFRELIPPTAGRWVIVQLCLSRT